MKRDFNPVGVKLNIENPSIERDAFYRLCFITESDIAPRTLKVTRLQDLLESGYSRLDLVYNFCVGVFSQQGIDTVYIRAKRSSESYVEAYNSDDNSMYYFVVLQTKDLLEIEKFNNHLVSSDEMKLQFFSQNVGSKTLQSPKLVNYYQDYTRPEGGVSSDDRDFYLNSAYEGLVSQIKLSLPDYLVSGLGDIAIDYGIYNMTGKKQIWEIDKAERRIRYAPKVLQQGWVGSQEESTVIGSDITVVAYKGSVGASKKSTVLNPRVKVETLSRELLKGLGKEVLDYAVPLIDPEAKDWVLDPENNSVKYKNPDYADTGAPDASGRYPYIWSNDRVTGSSAKSACESWNGSNGFVHHSTVIISDTEALCRAVKGDGNPVDNMYLDRKPNPAYTGAVAAGGSGAYSYEAYGTQHYYSSLSAACAGALSISNNAGQFIGAHISDTEKIRDTEYRCHYDGAGSGYFEVSYNPDYEAPPSVDKHIPIDTVAAKIISNADAGHLESKEFLKSIPLFAYILTGSGTEAVNKAVLDINPEATDWVLDPANNAVKYAVAATGSASQQYIISYQPTIGELSGQSYPTAQAAADAVCSLAGKNGFDYWYDGIPSASINVSALRCKGGAGGSVYYSSVLNPDYDPDSGGDTGYYYQMIDQFGDSTVKYESLDLICQQLSWVGGGGNECYLEGNSVKIRTPTGGSLGVYGYRFENPDYIPPAEEKSIPIDTVAQQVIANAEAEHAPSQEALRLSTVERVNIGEYDEALEATSSTIDTWKYLPIFDVAVQVKRNSIAGHAESIEAVNNSLPFVIPNYEPNVTITGIAKVGEVLTATVTDKNGVPSDINYQWYADDEVISGATSETYVLKEAEAGKVITVEADFTDNDGYVESVISSASELVVPDNPPIDSFILEFKSDDTFTVPEGVSNIDVLIVGGGGGGGSRQGGGGGAGGVTVLNNYKVTPMSEIPILVGSGGSGGIDGSKGNSGNNSSFDSKISIGGGWGGGRTTGSDGGSGGSGGGGASGAAGGIPTPFQGNHGGNAPERVNLAGGGGGATAVGESPSYTGDNDYEGDAGDGGDGAYFKALKDYGDSGYFSGGGGGGGYNTLSGNPEGAGKGGKGGGGDGVVGSDNPSYLGGDGYAGLENTGGGGGGSTSGDFSGGNGGSGVVIVVYPAGQLEPILMQPILMAKHAITVGT